MAREFAKWFYDSSAWRKCRASYISKRQGIDGGMCERCRERPGYIVHHKIAITPANINDPDVSLSFRNFEYVCQECHNKAHGKDKPEPRVIFTEDGDVCPILPLNLFIFLFGDNRLPRLIFMREVLREGCGIDERR